MSCGFKHFLRFLLLLVVSGACIQCTGPDEGVDPEEKRIDDTEVWNLEDKGIPEFLGAYLSSSQVTRISKFRSGVGHDYSDDFEACRSMKHYFEVPEGTEVRAPLQGEIVWMEKEWAGHKLGIRSKEFPAFVVEIFHVTLEGNLQVGTLLEEGSLLGYHVTPNTASDIAVMVQTTLDGPNDNTLPRSNGIKLLSYFECMKKSVLEEYQTGFRNGVETGDFIISKEARDMESFDCERDWQFGGERPEYWVNRN